MVLSINQLEGYLIENCCCGSTYNENVLSTRITSSEFELDDEVEEVYILKVW